MKTIGIADFQALVKKCLTDPDLFINKSIVLWNADYQHYGMAYSIIKECCLDFNRKNPNDQVWFKDSDMTFKTDDIAKVEALCDRKDMYGIKTRGILFNTGCFTTNERKEWLEFINNHRNDKGLLSNDWVLIACAHQLDYNLAESDFSNNCDIYSIQPTIAEWAKWSSQSYSKELLNPIVAFIKKKSPSISFDNWLRCLDRLQQLLFKYKAIKQIPKKQYELDLRGTMYNVHDFPFEELWEYLQSPVGGIKK